MNTSHGTFNNLSFESIINQQIDEAIVGQGFLFSFLTFILISF